MKTLNELKQENKLSNVSFLRICASRERYKATAKFGHLLPTTPAQIKYYIRTGVCLGELGMPDCEYVTEILAKNGIEAKFTYTKSGNFARLANGNWQLWEAMQQQLQ